MSVDLTPVVSTSDEVTPMEVSTKNEKVSSDDSTFVCARIIMHVCMCAYMWIYRRYFDDSNCLVHLCRNVKWGSDEISVVVKTDGQCLMCFPEICEKIMLDQSTELLTKKLTNLKIQLVDGNDILKESSHIHDTPSQSCQMIQYQDLLGVLKHFNYKVPESFERAVTSLENEVIYLYFNGDIIIL